MQPRSIKARAGFAFYLLILFNGLENVQISVIYFPQGFVWSEFSLDPRTWCHAGSDA